MRPNPAWFANLRGSAISDIVGRYKLGTFALSFHYEMLVDQKRVDGFRKAIDTLVQPRHVVLDVGTGSGVLALLAARHAERVYAIEMDHCLASVAAENFRRSEFRQKLTLTVGDATRLSLPEPVDIILCEMMDTVLLNEPQVPVLHAITKRVLKPSGIIIPAAVQTSGALTHCDFEPSGISMRVAHWERTDLPNAQPLSKPVDIYKAIFLQDIDEVVEQWLSFMITESGIANSLRLRSHVEFCSGHTLDECPTLNNPIIVPLKMDVPVEKGQSVQVHIRYQHYSDFNRVEAEAKVE